MRSAASKPSRGGRRMAALSGFVRAAVGASFCLALAAAAEARDGDAAAVGIASRVFMGEPHDVVAHDGVVYAALDSGVAAYSVGGATEPIFLGHASLPSAALGLAVEKAIVFVADDESGLLILEAADPVQMHVLAALPTAGRARGIAVFGNLVFIAEAGDGGGGGDGLLVVDVADPTAPKELSFLPLSNGALSVAIAGSHAYVGLGSSLLSSKHGLVVVDITSPPAPAVAAFLPTQEPVNDVEVAGNVAYLATGFAVRGAFVTADVSVPSAPVVLARKALGDAARGVSVLADSAYVAASALGLISFDVSNPALPRLADDLPTGRLAQAVVALPSGIALIAERSSDGAGGLTAATTPQPPGRLALIASAGSAEATGVAAEGDTYYLLRRTELSIVDGSVPAAPVVLGAWAPPGADFVAVAAQGDVVAVADGAAVRLVDAANDAGPLEVGVATLGCGFAVKPVLDDPRLYVLNAEGYEAFDIANRAAPLSLGSYDADGWAADLAVAGAAGYLVVGSKLRILDLSAPATPTILGELSLPDQLYGVAVQGGLAVITGLGAALYAVDVSNPALPTLLGTLPGGPGFAVTLRGTIAAVACGDLGIKIVDVTNPASLSLLGSYDTSGAAAAVAGSGATYALATSAAQHWFLTCRTCTPGTTCRVDAVVHAVTTRVCEGTPITLDASATQATGCTGNALDYQWFENAVVIPGATTPIYVVPGTHPPGAPQFTLAATCRANPSCSGVSSSFSLAIDAAAWPIIGDNSLKLARLAGVGQTLSWTVVAGVGQSNVHRTLDKTALTGLWADMSSLVGTSPTTSYNDAFSAPADSVGLYQVYGRDSCRGLSVAP